MPAGCLGQAVFQEQDHAAGLPLAVCLEFAVYLALEPALVVLAPYLAIPIGMLPLEVSVAVVVAALGLEAGVSQDLSAKMMQIFAPVNNAVVEPAEVPAGSTAKLAVEKLIIVDGVAVVLVAKIDVVLFE